MADGRLCVLRTLLLQGSYVEHRLRSQKAFEREFPQGLRLEQLLQCHVDPLADEDLATAGLSTQAGGEVGDRANGRVIHPTFKADHAHGGVTVGNAYPKVQDVSTPLPLVSQFTHLL